VNRSPLIGTRFYNFQPPTLTLSPQTSIPKIYTFYLFIKSCFRHHGTIFMLLWTWKNIVMKKFIRHEGHMLYRWLLITALYAVRSPISATAAKGFLFVLINWISSTRKRFFSCDYHVCSWTRSKKYSQFKVGGGGHFEIQYGGHRGQIWGGPISENICTILVNTCAKFGAFITKCTIWSNIGT